MIEITLTSGKIVGVELTVGQLVAFENMETGSFGEVARLIDEVVVDGVAKSISELPAEDGIELVRELPLAIAGMINPDAKKKSSDVDPSSS